jgi:hypothetical protein
MVIRVGTGTPGSMCVVLALNSLQKSMDFTPRAPRAGPTGGVGAALPAGISKRYIWWDTGYLRGNKTYHYLGSCCWGCSGHEKVKVRGCDLWRCVVSVTQPTGKLQWYSS